MEFTEIGKNSLRWEIIYPAQSCLHTVLLHHWLVIQCLVKSSQVYEKSEKMQMCVDCKLTAMMCMHAEYIVGESYVPHKL